MKEQLNRPASELGSFSSSQFVNPEEEVTQRIKAELFFADMIVKAIDRVEVIGFAKEKKE